MVTSRRRGAGEGGHLPEATLAGEPSLASPLRYPARPAPGWIATVLLAGVVAVGAAIASRPSIGLVAGVATVVATKVPTTRVLLTFAIPVTLIVSRLEHRPELAWLALALLAVDLAGGWLRSREPEPAASGN